MSDQELYLRLNLPDALQSNGTVPLATQIRNHPKALGRRNEGLTRGQQKQVYLFSGLLRRGECGGSITLVDGRAKTSRSEYGCSLHAQRGDSVCKNDLLIRRDHLEDHLINGLQERVLREEAIDYTVLALQDELRRRHESLDAELRSARDEENASM